MEQRRAPAPGVKPSTLAKRGHETLRSAAAVAVVSFIAFCGVVNAADKVPAPTEADRVWLLGDPVAPDDNKPNLARIELGKALFFDPRLSGNGTVSCASCHNPALGWSDGLATGVGINGTVLGRATPTIVNTAYNTQFMWDGRKKSLEDQALGPMKTPEEMKTDFGAAVDLLKRLPGYQAMFKSAYPGEAIAEETIAKAIASFERTVVSKDSRFDRWVAGDRKAITMSEWRGYQVFMDSNKGNCAVCHRAPNFTDNGYHNIGIAHPAGKEDLGRYKIRPAAILKGAFKTPTLRDVELTAPYFHNGTAANLAEVVDHYVRGGDDQSNLSPDMKKLSLTDSERSDLVAFLRTLTGAKKDANVPVLPH